MAGEPADSQVLQELIEPLCKATSTLLSPLRLRDTDHLFVWMSPKGRFFMDVRCIVREVRPAPDAAAGPLFASAVGESRYVERTYPGVSYQAQDVFNRIPERTFVGGNDWHKRFLHECAATDFTALVVHHAWGKSRIHFRKPGLDDDGQFLYPHDEEAELTYGTLIRGFFAQTRRSRAIASFKQDGTMPGLADDWTESPDLPLAAYQRAAAVFACEPSPIGVFFDQGTGKTAVAIQAICQRARRKRNHRGEMLRALVVCPNQVRLNWATEFRRFASVAGKVTVVKGTAVRRIELLQHVLVSEDDCAFSVGIISFGSAVSSVEVLERIPWDMVVFDESHKFKSSSTGRWDMVQRLRDSAKRVIPMTGTPIGNSVFDLWTQLESMGKGTSGFERYNAFRKFYGQWRRIEGPRRGIEKLEGLQNVPLLHERLARLTFRVTKDEAGLNLPDKVYDLMEVEMSERQLHVYRKVAEQVTVEIEDKLSGEVDEMTIQNILTMLLRLAQVTSGHLVWDAVYDAHTGDLVRPKRIEPIEPNAKVQALVDEIADPDRDPLSKTIVMACFRPDIERLARAFDEAGIGYASYYGGVPDRKRDEEVRRFNEDPTCKVFVGNPKSSGEGLNLLGYDWDNPKGPQLDTYADWVVFFSCNWSALERSQAEDRAHRRGTRMPVRITDLIVPDTIDEEIRKRVSTKREMAEAALDIRGVLSSVLNIEALA